MSNITDREEIKLNTLQEKMLVSGWGIETKDNSIVEKITYISDGLKVKGYIAYPKDTAGKKLPCIIWNRGGYGDKGAIDLFTAKGIFGSLASWGYVVFASQYRGNAGGQGNEELGGRDVYDVLNLMQLADELSFADKTKWGIEGWSRGGMMTFLTLLKNKNFKCAVLSGAISDLKSYAESVPSIYESYSNVLGAEELDKKLYNRSAINFVKQLPDIPYLLMHGGADETVPPVQSLKLAEKMYESRIAHRLIIFEGGDHYLKNYRQEVDDLRRKWYSTYLK